MKGYMYILECCDGSFYTGSTVNLEIRIHQHESGMGANHTSTRLPVKLVYYEEFDRIHKAFYREKQVQGWSRKKKEALINGFNIKLPELSIAYRDLKAQVAEVLEAQVAEALEAQVAEALEATLQKPNTQCLREPQAPRRTSLPGLRSTGG